MRKGMSNYKLIKQIAIALTMSTTLAGQVQWSDDFADGDFISNPAWLGDTGVFQVNAQGELQLVDSLAGNNYLATTSNFGLKASWQWYCRFDFNPSSANFLRVYLMSDQPVLDGKTRGYYLRIGGSSSDRISLYRQDDNTHVLLAESSVDWTDSNPFEAYFQVTRDADYRWEVQVDTALNGNKQPLFSVSDSTWLASNYFGLCPNYTKTRADRFYFDDFLGSGEVYIDRSPPRLLKVNVEDSLAIRLSFSEGLDSTTAADTASYRIHPQIGAPLSVDLVASDQLVLGLDRPLSANKTYHLVIKDVADPSGNICDTLVALRYYRSAYGDLEINELMVDPTPVVGLPPYDLPEAEYIEIFNRLSWPVNLNNWLLRIDDRDHVLPDFTLPAGEYLVLTAEESATSFGDTLPVLGMDLSRSALLNSGTRITLLDPAGKAVSAVDYTKDYYQNQLKSQGGWSLERRNPWVSCAGMINWEASWHPRGGTPGRPNSLDSTQVYEGGFRVSELVLLSDRRLALRFSLDLTQLPDTDLIQVEPSVPITGLNFRDDKLHELTVNFGRRLQPGALYRMVVSDTITACTGQFLSGDSLNFGLPVPPEEGDILLNEILFNPAAGGADFVELFNASQSIFDLSRLRLGNWDEMSGIPTNAELISDESSLFLPGSYLLLTEDTASIARDYNIKDPKALKQVERLPSLPNDNGSLALETSALGVVDYLVYSEDMHHPLLENPEGVSFERLSMAKPTTAPDNWHSAAASAGFATPGYRNSQQQVYQASASLQLVPRLFSPNMDGYHDLLGINYRMKKAGLIGSISIWEAGGQPVRRLRQQVLLGQQGSFYWDGTDDNGRILGPGIYVVVFESFGVEEKRSVIRKTCVLSP